MKIGAADAAKRDTNQDLTRCWLGSGIFLENEGVGLDGRRKMKDDGLHGRATPHPPCFDKRGCKLLKTTDSASKKRAKRTKERAKRRQAKENEHFVRYRIVR